jgi:DNA-binding winged helix-turn-helix (wHTH) protein
MAFEFGECVLDPVARRLTRHGTPVPITLKAFDVLLLLISNRPRAVSKAEILDRVWPNTFVSDASLARTINEIRKAIGESGPFGSAIRTVHAFGYAFAAEVREQGRPRTDASLPIGWLRHGREEFAVFSGGAVIGRAPEVDIRLDSPRVSRHHARVTLGDAGIIIEDLGSRNGTFVNDSRIEGPTLLQSGAALRIGGFRLVLRVADALLSETELDETV